MPIEGQTAEPRAFFTTLGALRGVAATLVLCFHAALFHVGPYFVGATNFSIPASNTKAVTIKLTAKARKLLAKESRLAVLESVVAHDNGGISKMATARIAIKVAKKHRRH